MRRKQYLLTPINFAIIMTTVFSASDSAIMDLHALAIQNQNPKISHYRQGYEQEFSNMPIIKSVTTNWDLQIVAEIMHRITANLASQDWVKNNTPIKRPLLRTVIAMEKPVCTGAALKDGAELIVVNWKAGAKTPTHGHARGYMHERLIFGKVKQGTYRIVDAEKRIARPISIELFCNTNDIIDAGFNDDHSVQDGAFVHDFEFLEPTATLNLVPGHPKDTKGNCFTVEQFGFKHLNFQLEKLVPISLGGTLHLPPGEVILVRSATTKDLGDHFYVITERPHQKKAGMRPVGRAIQASEDFSKLLDAVEPQEGGVQILRLMPEVRDWFLEWHGIQVEKNIVFPKP